MDEDDPLALATLGGRGFAAASDIGVAPRSATRRSSFRWRGRRTPWPTPI